MNVMSTTIPPTPSIGEIQAVMRTGDQLAQQAAMQIKPPDQVDPQDVKVVRETLRRAEQAQVEGRIDITV